MSASAADAAPIVVLRFDQGTLVVDGVLDADTTAALSTTGFLADERSGGRLRAPAIAYRRALAVLMRSPHDVRDEARAYEALDAPLRRERVPYPHQAQALEAWIAGRRRGLVVLPTGAGKSYVAELAIARTDRSTLVVVPTIDLMNQWVVGLSLAFGPELTGAVGGGSFDVKPLTVTTYDSAYLHMGELGARFGLLIFDECHHLPSAAYAQAAELAIAPFRLGLTATPERQDGSHEALDRLVGPLVFRRDIQDMKGVYLADYETVRLTVSLSPDEQTRYQAARAEYRGFVDANMIRMSRPDGWARFLAATSRSTTGRRAWRAWREQRRIALQCEAKLHALAALLAQHAGEQAIIFTADNDTVYRIARRHLIPPITHQTPAIERRETLAAFNEGTLRTLVTSRVLNEGVDLPAASVGIVLSGSSSVREHVQRLGRILRKYGDKEAVLYEVVTAATSEEHASERRREHGAYR